MPHDDMMYRRKKVSPSKAKAREILHHGEVMGHPLTEKQMGFMGARAGGAATKRRRRRAK